jgi:hypothetical protein
MDNNSAKTQRPQEGRNKLLSTPSLVTGEDGETFAKLHAEIEEFVEPRNIWDRMRVSDIAYRYREQQRYRGAAAAVVNSNRRQALVTILNVGVGLRPRDARAAADIYFGLAREDKGISLTQSELGTVKLPRNRAAVVDLLRRHGFSEDDIDHVAVQMSADTLAGLENLALKHETRREAIFAELMRDRKRQREDERNPTQEPARRPPRAASAANGAAHGVAVS